jgi:hypothetical protein
MAGPAAPEHPVVQIERERLAALVARDLARAEALHADDYQLITPGGRALSKREYLDGVGTGGLQYVVFEAASEPLIHAFDEVAVVRYRARIEIDLPDGRDTGLFWHTDIYEQRGGRWQAVWSHATRIRD